MTTGEELVLPARAASASAARRWVTSRLLELGLEPLVDEVELLTSELVSNAVIHAGTQMRVTVRAAAGGVRVEVRDGSTAPPVRGWHSATATTGRGIAMLDTVAAEWGWTADADGKTVWFRLGGSSLGRPEDLDAVGSGKALSPSQSHHPSTLGRGPLEP